jgi:hypothetical protein
MHNFKYHSLDELEKLIEICKNELAVLNTYGPDDMNDHRAQARQYHGDMLREAEFEVMERTLLK